MSTLDDLKDELEFELSARAQGLGLSGTNKVVRDAIEVGWIQLDAGATYGEARRAAMLALAENEREAA